MAKSAASSLSSAASKSASSLSSAASKSASSVSLAAASASARAAGENPTLATTSTTSIVSTSLIAITAIVGLLVGLHFSGTLDPVYEWVAEKFFKAEAKAEFVALENSGSKEVQDKMKEKLKGNPVVGEGEGELNDIAKGKVNLGGKLGL